MWAVLADEPEEEELRRRAAMEGSEEDEEEDNVQEQEEEVLHSSPRMIRKGNYRGPGRTIAKITKKIVRNSTSIDFKIAQK